MIFALPLCKHLKNVCVDVLNVGFIWLWDWTALVGKNILYKTQIFNIQPLQHSSISTGGLKYSRMHRCVGFYRLLLSWSGLRWGLRSSSES